MPRAQDHKNEALTREDRRQRRLLRRERQRQDNIGRAAKMHAARLQMERAGQGQSVPALKASAYVGCSGWFYWKWRGSFYPDDLPTGQWFRRYLLHLISVAALGALGGYWLMQPRVIANLGLAVYKPPPATRLIPLPRKSDAPELVDLTPTPSDGADAKLDSPPVTTSKATVQTSPKPTAKRSKPKLQHDNAASAYAYAGSWGYRERRSYPDWSDRRWSSWGGGRNASW
jgi:hypothetical protein